MRFLHQLRSQELDVRLRPLGTSDGTQSPEAVDLVSLAMHTRPCLRQSLTLSGGG